MLAQSVDRVLMVVSRTKSHQEAVQKACRQLIEAGAKNVNVVINRAERNKMYYYYQRRKDVSEMG
jgi:CO dehydrogenase nickel-insertion accessory protein CooC1